MGNKKKLLYEIMDNIPILIIIIGYVGFAIGCIVDSIFTWIAVFTGKMMISANVYLLLIGAPIISAPVICLASILIIRLFEFFIK